MVWFLKCVTLNYKFYIGARPIKYMVTNYVSNFTFFKKEMNLENEWMHVVWQYNALVWLLSKSI